MFDDQNSNTNVPNNLPVDEPEDMFGSVENSENATNEPIGENSALDAGVLKPKKNDDFNSIKKDEVKEEPEVVHTPPMPLENLASINKIKEPVLMRGIMLIIIALLAVGIVGGGAWWLYRYITAPEVVDKSENNAVGQNTSTTDNGQDEQNSSKDEVQNKVDSNENDAVNVDESILFGPPLDSDGDNLDNQAEASYNTDPNNWDTDFDGASDYDEIMVWKTDPLNQDTDGDSFMDGTEIKKGYNPKGPGKLFGNATSTPTNSVSEKTSTK